MGEGQGGEWGGRAGLEHRWVWLFWSNWTLLEACFKVCCCCRKRDRVKNRPKMAFRLPLRISGLAEKEKNLDDILFQILMSTGLVSQLTFSAKSLYIHPFSSQEAQTGINVLNLFKRKTWTYIKSLLSEIKPKPFLKCDSGNVLVCTLHSGVQGILPNKWRSIGYCGSVLRCSCDITMYILTTDRSTLVNTRVLRSTQPDIVLPEVVS